MPITEACRVVKADKKRIYIETVKNAKCESCKACNFGRRNTVTMPAYGDISCRKGDMVLVELPQAQIKTAALVLYVLPLLFFLGGLLAGMPLGEGFMLLFAVLFMTVGFVAAYGIDRLYRRQKKFLPRILQKICSEKENTNDRP